MNIRWNLSGMEIERESFRVIESECDLHKRMPAPEWRVARRLIHTTADMSIADTLVFRHDAIGSGLCALRAGAPIFCDSKMIRAGLSIERLKRLNPGYGPESLHCHISDQDVIDRAKLEGHTRALCSAEKARPMLDGAIVLIGNAPLALARIARYALEEGVRPLSSGCPSDLSTWWSQRNSLPSATFPRSSLKDGAAAAPSPSPRFTPLWRARRDMELGEALREEFVPAGNRISII